MAKKLICEICGSTQLEKQGDCFVCSGCGTKYSLEDAKKLLQDVPDSEAPQAAQPAADANSKLNNLYEIARRASSDGNNEQAAKYYEMILVEDAMSWEAAFLSVYHKAMQTKIANIASAANRVRNAIGTTLDLIEGHVSDPEEQLKAVRTVFTKVMMIAVMLESAAKSHFQKFSTTNGAAQEYLDRAIASRDLLYTLGNQIEKRYTSMSVALWESGIKMHMSFIHLLANKEANMAIVTEYSDKIRKYKPEFVTPELPQKKSSGGCYVATAVYGSYDCPQVWTLRRFRDNRLAETWHGRAFIRTYYAISPTLVRWFGDCAWFRKMWRGTLDRMVSRLQREGVEDTPYADREW